MRELREVYGAFASGRGSPLPELSVQYRDFARWQREAMDSKVMRAQLEYWREHLANLPPALALPQDFSRPAVQTYRGETLRIELPPTLPSALRTFCRAERVTLYTAMYAAFVVLLRRYSGERDVCVGSAYANRQSHQTQDVIGMLVNPVLLRLAVDDGQSFRELAGQARGVVLGASRNQELPFPVLVRELNPARDVTGNPLVRILFSANDSPMPQLDLGGATGTVYERGNGSAKMDLDVVVIPRAESQMGDAGHTEDRILLMWEYNADLYDPRTMRQMVDAYLRLLEDCVRRPDAALGDLRLLTEHEQERILRAYNPAHAGDAGPPVHLAVAAHARANPDALAVITSSERLSYAELDRRAGWLAMRLRELGAGPERIVGICLPRGTDLIVAQLGILRAGAAYLPLDPDYPAERLAYLCADAGANLVVSAGPYAAKLPAATRRVVLDDLPGGPPPAEPPPAWAHTPWPTSSTPRVRAESPRVWWSTTERCPTSFAGTWRSSSSPRPTGSAWWPPRASTPPWARSGPRSPQERRCMSPTPRSVWRRAACRHGCSTSESPSATCRRCSPRRSWCCRGRPTPPCGT